MKKRWQLYLLILHQTCKHVKLPIANKPHIQAVDKTDSCHLTSHSNWNTAVAHGAGQDFKYLPGDRAPWFFFVLVGKCPSCTSN